MESLFVPAIQTGVLGAAQVRINSSVPVPEATCGPSELDGVGSHGPLTGSFQSSSVSEYRRNKQTTEICIGQGTLRQLGTLPVSGLADPTQQEPGHWGWPRSIHLSHTW